jgi:hypothetical protein
MFVNMRVCDSGSAGSTDMRNLVYLVTSILLTTFGCVPSWHSGRERLRVWHTIDRAVVYDDALSVQGWIGPIVAFTDYGLKVNHIDDDTGKPLAFRSFQTFWAKALRFELECAAPNPSAKSVLIDIDFVTRSGKQSLRQTVSIEREPRRDYRTQLDAWELAKPVAR